MEELVVVVVVVVFGLAVSESGLGVGGGRIHCVSAAGCHEGCGQWVRGSRRRAVRSGDSSSHEMRPPSSTSV